VRLRTALALGMVVALIVGLGMLPAASPVIAQDDSPGLEPVEPPPSLAPPSGQPETKPAGEPKPSGPTQPSGPAPAFSPSGAGTGTSTGSGASGPLPKPAAPKIPPPPAIAAGVYSHSLGDGTVFPAGRCFWGYAQGMHVGEGFKLRVNGPCADSGPVADIAVDAKGIKIGDGDVALDFKVVDGVSRVRIGLYMRTLDGKSIIAYVSPNSGVASLMQLLKDNKEEPLAERSDLGSLMKPTDWNRLALRVNGLNSWVLINDEPVLYSAGDVYEAGKMGLYLMREGDPDDEYETAVVFRDLTLSTLEGADPARAPTKP
jgi:hypothetical protein